MKGILPPLCRPIGYVLMILAVFVPMILMMFSMISETNVMLVKLLMKVVVWLTLFMVFLAKRKDESQETARLRTCALKYGLYIWGIYYLAVVAIAAYNGDTSHTDNSIGYIYMVIIVFILEVLIRKQKAENMFRKK